MLRVAGFGQPSELGQRPCLIVVDMQNRFLGEKAPLLESVKSYPASMGQLAWDLIPRQKAVLASARAAGLPIVFSYISKMPRKVAGKAMDLGVEAARTGRGGGDLPETEDPEWGPQISAELAPNPEHGEVLLDKNYASCFYATPLLSYLTSFKADSVIIIGVSTAGCVRATAVDASSMNFKVIVLEDCVMDRVQASHKASLLDIWTRYGEVWAAERGIQYIESL